MGTNSIPSGWDQGREAGAWTSLTQKSGASFKSSTRVGGGEFSAPAVLARLQLDPEKMGPRFSAELASLARERDPEMFFAGLLQLGQRLQAQGKLEAAAQVYSEIARLPEPSLVEERATNTRDARKNAQAKLQALSGQGPWAFRSEILIDGFVETVTDPAILLAMGVGGITYRTVRLGTLSRLLASPHGNLLTSRWGARAAAGLLGFAAEVPAFTLAAKGGGELLGRNPSWDGQALRHEAASAALLLGPLKLAGLAGKTLGPTSRLLPQLGMYGGILVGSRLQMAAGLRPASDTGSLLSESLATLLQFNVAGNLGRALMGERFSRWEKNLDRVADSLRRENPVAGPFHNLGRPLFAHQGSGSISFPPHLPSKVLWGDVLPADFLQSKMSAWDEGITSRARDLLPGLRGRFPAPGHDVFSEDILQTACRIRCELPGFHQRLLNFLAGRADRGTLNQYHQVLALEDLFEADSLNNATGTMDYALLQYFIRQAVQDPIAHRGNRALSELFEKMSPGLSREVLEGLIRRYFYGRNLKVFPTPDHPRFENFYFQYWPRARAAWNPPSGMGIPGEFRPMVLHFIYHYSQEHRLDPLKLIQIWAQAAQSERYDPKDLQEALAHAKIHPMGMLFLRRMHQIFAVEDIPQKLQEILPQPVLGISEVIHGTHHTGLLRDTRLTEKVLEFYREAEKIRAHPERHAAQRERLLKAFWEFVAKKKTLASADILDFLAINPTVDSRALAGALSGKKITLEVLDTATFEDWAERGDLNTENTVSIFIKAIRPGEKDRLIIRQLPPLDLGTPQGEKAAFNELLERLAGTIHEFEHWRHFTEGQNPISMEKMTREDRLKSEMLAYLAELTWRVQALRVPFWDVSKVLGEPLAVYLRNIADVFYFKISNENRVREILQGR